MTASAPPQTEKTEIFRCAIARCLASCRSDRRPRRLARTEGRTPTDQVAPNNAPSGPARPKRFRLSEGHVSFEGLQKRRRRDFQAARSFDRTDRTRSPPFRYRRRPPKTTDPHYKGLPPQTPSQSTRPWNSRPAIILSNVLVRQKLFQLLHKMRGVLRAIVSV